MKVLLGITGGIAAYKTPDLVRRLRERGADVRVVMTDSASRFVTATSLQAVSGHRVRTSLWDEEAEAAMGHIELARWADQVLIAPATAETIARLANGHAPDLLSTLCLATRAPVAIAPAMNNAMWEAPAVQQNIATLKSRDVTVLGPASGAQACGETGEGRMLEPLDIAEAVAGLARIDGPLSGKTVLITAGPTREPIDPVRYLTNRSSGKMGYAVAAAARAAGAKVVLISGPVALDAPQGIERVSVQTAAEMFEAAMERASDSDIFIASAAVADYSPQTVATSKIKKDDAECRLDLSRTKDILGSVAGIPDGPFAVGFAAETDNVREYALSKFQKKNLDIIIANRVGEGLAFDCDDNAVEVYFHGGEQAFPTMSKTELAGRLVDLIAERYNESKRTAAPLNLIASRD